MVVVILCLATMSDPFFLIFCVFCKSVCVRINMCAAKGVCVLVGWVVEQLRAFSMPCVCTFKFSSCFLFLIYFHNVSKKKKPCGSFLIIANVFYFSVIFILFFVIGFSPAENRDM